MLQIKFVIAVAIPELPSIIAINFDCTVVDYTAIKVIRLDCSNLNSFNKHLCTPGPSCHTRFLLISILVKCNIFDQFFILH